MPRVVLAPAIARWLTPHPTGFASEAKLEVTAGSVRECLEQIFQRHPALRGYLVDERGVLRHHVVAFLDGVAVADKTNLADAVAEDSELYLFQALSGG